MSNKTKTNFISAPVKKVLSLSLLVTGGVVMSSMALALLLQDTASSNNEKVQVWGIQSRVQYLTGMTLSWANSDRIKFEYKEDTNALNFNGAMNLHALVIGSTNEGATGSTVIGGNNNVVKWNWQNAAIIGGNKNTVTNTTTSIIAGATGSHIANVQDSAIFSAEGTIIGSDNTTDTMFIVWGKGHVARGRNTNFIAGSENIQTDQNAQNNVLIGKKIRSNQSNIFVWSNGNTELTPQKGSAFYVNSTSGFGLNTNNPQAALDIANGGLAFNKVYQLSEISDVNVAGVHTVVQKDGKQGVCGYNGSTWVPLTLNAEREGLCTASTQSTPPKHATSTISGAVQFSGQPVVTNGTTLLHQVWSGGMNNNHGGWLNHPWTYKHTGPLDNGDYRCGIGFHMGNPTPDGMKNTDCKACSPITNQRDWRSNGKNDDCDFSCKAGFKKVGRTCTACEVGTYTTDGTVANSCASCTNKPANAHYTTNGINANACQWACDAGYYNVGWACKKAIWQKTDTYTCNVAGGVWKDDKIVTTYHCALEENRGVSVPEHICNHWWAKPATTTVVKWDVNCNPPQWETNWSCPTPNCNISRIAGKCGGATEAVTCIQHKRDRAWNSYETRTQSQQKACTRVCETALCGGANGVATKYQPTALCAAGTASAVGGNASVWSWTCTQLDGAKNCSATRIPLQAGSCGASHNINHNALNAASADLCNYGTVISFNENTALFANRWSWKCRGDNGAHNQDVNCIAHKPAPQAGQCAQALNTCTVGTVKDTTNIPNGKRWSCEGLHGWSTDTTCSLCDNGYVYNSATNRCDPKCGAGYTLHNGYCVKWKCETTPASTTPWKCEGSYSQTIIEYEGVDASGYKQCMGGRDEELDPSCCEANADTERCWGGLGTWMIKDSTNPNWRIYCGEHGECPYTCIKEPENHPWMCQRKTRQIPQSCSSLNQTECGSKSWCTRTSWTTPPRPSLPRPPVPSTPGRCVGSYTTPAKCEPTAEHGRYEYSDDTSFACENFNGFSDECNNTLGVRIQLDGYWVPKEVAARFSDYWWFRSIVFPSGVWMWDPSRWPIFAKCSDELAPLWNACPYFERVKWSNFYNEVWNILDVKSICVFKNSTSQSCNWLTQTECGKQSWCTRTSWGSSSPVPPRPPRPWRPKLPPSAPSIPWSPSKVVKCMDEQWNERPDAYCANAGAKPLCDAEWACAVPTVQWSQGCINATTKDHTSQCRTDLSLNNALSCNNATEVKKHCLPMRRRDCASDEYWFNGGSEWEISTMITWGFEKTLQWDPQRNLYKSSLPGQEAFGYEIVGACSRGEPKASASCISASWKYDQYCAQQPSIWACGMVNVYQKRERFGSEITVWVFKKWGQCWVATYSFNDWEEQYDPICPGIHGKSFKYMDSCIWWVKKDVICQSASSNGIVDDLNCRSIPKPSYSMVCWEKETPWTPTPSTPPMPSVPSATALYMHHYDPYKFLDENLLTPCRHSWNCRTSCSAVWSFAQAYDSKYWWAARKPLVSEFFCAHGPYWGSTAYTTKPIYIKGDWRPDRYRWTSLENYTFWLDADYTIPAPNGVYDTNLTAAHASSANESFFEEKVHLMYLYNGKILTPFNWGFEVIQEK